MSAILDVERAVADRYTQAALEQVSALCCPVTYDPKYLSVIPQEIIDRDYGCGDPSAFVREGAVALDLGSGSGKICYIAAQIAGPGGRVIGVDANTEMLALANKYRGEIGDELGYHRGFLVADVQLHPQDRELPLLDQFLSHQRVPHATGRRPGSAAPTRCLDC